MEEGAKGVDGSWFVVRGPWLIEKSMNSEQKLMTCDFVTLQLIKRS